MAIPVLALTGLAAAALLLVEQFGLKPVRRPRRPRRWGQVARRSSTGVNLSSVTLDIGDQKGTGAEAVLQAAACSARFRSMSAGPTSPPAPRCWRRWARARSTSAVSAMRRRYSRRPAVRRSRSSVQGRTNGDQDAVVVPKSSPITAITQLKGKKIAYGAGSSANYNLLTVLTKAGLTTKDVTLVNLQPAEALAAFTSGSVDAWDIWPPYVQQVVAQDGAKVLATAARTAARTHSRSRPRPRWPTRKRPRPSRSTCRRWTRPTSGPKRTPDAWATAWGAAAGLPGQCHGRGGEGRLHRPSRSPARSRRPCRTWSPSSTRPGRSRKT